MRCHRCFRPGRPRDAGRRSRKQSLQTKARACLAVAKLLAQRSRNHPRNEVIPASERVRDRASKPLVFRVRSPRALPTGRGMSPMPAVSFYGDGETDGDAFVSSVSTPVKGSVLFFSAGGAVALFSELLGDS